MSKYYYIIVLYVCVLAALSGCTSPASVEFTVNGTRAFYDSRTNSYLCTTSKESFDNGTIDAVIGFDAASCKEFILDGKPVKNGGRITLTQLTAGKRYALTLKLSRGTIEATVEFTYLPTMRVKGKFDKIYRKGEIILNDPSTMTTSTYDAVLKWRGGNTNTINKHKRNYKVKLKNKTGRKARHELLGMRAESVWILDAAQMDKSRVRNRVATDVWNDIAPQPYHATPYVHIYTGSRGKPVEMFLNDEYVGIYYITEPMNNRQLYLEKYDRNAGIIHGELWKTHHYTKAVAFWDLNGSFNNLHDTWEGFETKYPDFSDDEAIDYSPLYDAIHFAVNSNSQQFNARAEEFFDVPVLINYIVLLQVFKAQDNECTNTYWFCPDQTVNKRLSLAVWDLDATCGMPQEPNKLKPEVLRADVPLSLHHGAYAGLLKNSSPYRERVWQRYKELRNGVLNSDSIVERYWAYYKSFKDCGAVKREQQRWNHDSDIFGAELNMESEIIAIDKWLRMRLEFLDQHMMEKIIDLENND